MMKIPRVIAGLGNPGAEYDRTRHNAGFWLVDELARRYAGSFRHESRFNADICKLAIGSRDLWLVKPMNFMNRSGGPLRAFLDYYRVDVDALLIAHDEIDLPVAALRLKEGGGHGGHNGLRDSIACLGATFFRLRIGVAHPGHRDDVVNYVLRRAPAEEQADLDAAIDRAADLVPTMLERGFAVAMNEINQRERKKKPRDKGAENGD